MKGSIKKVLSFLEEELKGIEAEIDAMVEEEEGLKGEVDLLESMKGIGKVTAITLAVKLPELGKVSHKKIASLVGLAPMSNESGKREGKRKIKGGRKEVGRSLYMAAAVAVRFNSVIRGYYQRLISRGKAKKAGMVGWRKMLVILNAMIREKRPFKIGENSHVIASQDNF